MAWREAPEPSALHNNCSGKHAGFICLSCAAGVEPSGYVAPEHFRCSGQVKTTIAGDVTLASGSIRGVPRQSTGCSIPTHALCYAAGAGAGIRPFRQWPRPVRRPRGRGGAHKARSRRASLLCRGFGTFRHFDYGGARASRLRQDRRGRRLLRGLFPNLRACASRSVKCQDGAGRAAETAMAAVIARFLPLTDAERAALAMRRDLAPPLHNWNGVKVSGEIKPTPVRRE